MRQALAAILAVLMLGACVTTWGPVNEERPFTSDREFRSWFAYYYQHPSPAKLTPALRYMEAHGYLDERNVEVRDAPLVASVFMSKVILSNLSLLPQWNASWQALGQREWYVLLVALYLTQDRGALRLMEANRHRVDRDHRQRLASMQKRPVAELDQLLAEVVSTRQINLVWAAFSATGDPRYVKKVIEAVQYYGDDSDQQAAIGEAALLSLATNAMGNKLVARLCEDEHGSTSDPKTRLLLTAMLSAVAEIAQSDALQGGEGRGVAPDWPGALSH